MADTVPQVDRILADAVVRSLEESDGHTIDVAAAATLARTVVPDLLAKVEKLTGERDEARRALARAERDERVVGYRKAIAELRNRSEFMTWSASNAGRAAMPGQSYPEVCASFLESRLSSTTEGPPPPPFEPLPEPARSEYEQAMRQPPTWSLPPEPGPEVKAVQSERGVLDRADERWVDQWGGEHEWHVALALFGPLTEVVDTDAQG